MDEPTARERPAEPSRRPSLLSVGQAAQSLGVSVSTVWRMIRRGALASVRAGGRRLIPEEALEARVRARQGDEIALFSEDHPIFRLVGAGRSGGRRPGARDKHAILDR